MSNIIWFYWDGHISKNRLRILHDSVYSTRVFNPNHDINIVSNTLQQSQFDDDFNIKVLSFDISWFDGIPINRNKVEKYLKAHPRNFSDLFRLILLYKFGGTYIDTDDLCIGSIKSPKNTICRSYDPHTSFYNKIEPNNCVPGFVREIDGYDNIPMFPRNDCWQNWEPFSPFILEILNNSKFKENEDVIWIGGDFSWQSIINETCINRLLSHKKEWNFGLTLIYLYEDFVAWSSFWDTCHHGGEFCDIWENLPNLKNYKWGEYKSDKKTANQLYDNVMNKYPWVSHMWLHLKDKKTEWLEDINENKLYSISTWILYFIREKINKYKKNIQ
jgi:hypothetical protein